MNKTEFKERVNTIIKESTQFAEGMEFEGVDVWAGTRITNVFQYAAISEHCMERQLEDLKGRERLTTFMSDLSIGEWCDGSAGVLDTIKRAMIEWCDDEEMMAEFVLCVNWKSWEHHARKNTSWVRLYSYLYDNVSRLMFEYYGDDEKKYVYLYEYLD